MFVKLKVEQTFLAPIKVKDNSYFYQKIDYFEINANCQHFNSTWK